MRHERVRVRRDERTVVSRTLPPWEIPILEFIFGEGNVERFEDFVTVDQEYPNESAEFERLERRYGADPETNIPFIASLYGQKSVGRKALARAIDEAKTEDKLAAKAMPKKAPARRVLREERDSLLS